MKPSIRTAEHVGEWKLSAHADTRTEVFALIAGAIAREVGGVRGAHNPWEAVQVDARDLNALLVEWANELIGRAEAMRRCYDDVRDIRISKHDGTLTLHASVRGRTVADWRSPVKAATYHGIGIARHAGRWRATLLLDV